MLYSFETWTFFRFSVRELLCLSLAAHTPDNSFMGFVAEELNETERLNIQRNKVNNMAVVYGKEVSMWKVSVTRWPSTNYLHVFIFCETVQFHTFTKRISNLRRLPRGFARTNDKDLKGTHTHTKNST